MNGALVESSAANLTPYFSIFLPGLTGSAGNAGTVQIKGGDITLTDARVDQLTYRVADATTPGRVEFIADDTVKFVRSIVDSSNIGSTVGAGEIFLNGRAVLLEDGSEVTTNAALGGSAGAIRIEASDRVVINTGLDHASPVLIASSVGPIQDPIRRFYEDQFTPEQLAAIPEIVQEGEGVAGSIGIKSGADIDIRDTWVVASTASTVQPTDAAGAALVGNITVDAAKSLQLTDATIAASTFGAANAGAISLTGETVSITGAGSFDAKLGDETRDDPTDNRTFTLRGIESSTYGAGAAGNLSIAGTSIELRDEATIAATAASGGDAGDISVSLQSAEGSLSLVDSTMTTNAVQSQGGDITIDGAGGVISLTDSAVQASAGADGAGGNIEINSPEGSLVLRRSKILATAVDGDGGFIELNLPDGAFAMDQRSSINADSNAGNDGEILINTPDLDVSAALQPQDVNVEAPPELRANACAPATQRQSTFVREGRGGVAESPDSYLPARSVAGSGGTTAHVAKGQAGATTLAHALPAGAGESARCL